jgi:hypothetical protein
MVRVTVRSSTSCDPVWQQCLGLLLYSRVSLAARSELNRWPIIQEYSEKREIKEVDKVVGGGKGGRRFVRLMFMASEQHWVF